MAAWAERDIEGLMACVSDDFVFVASVGPEPGATYAGRVSARYGVQAMWAVDAGSEAEILDLRVLGDWGFIRWIYRWFDGESTLSSEVGCDLVMFREGRLIRKDAFRKVRPAKTEVLVSPHETRRVPVRSGIGFVTREAKVSDASPLLALMRQLAEFEGYAEHFKVTEQDLLQRGLGQVGAREFSSIVAESDMGELWGYAVVYEIPFTYDLRPTMVLKELFVAESVRGMHIGAALMERVLAHAKSRNCPRLKWDVLPSNARAKELYRRWGGSPVRDWESWSLTMC